MTDNSNINMEILEETPNEYQELKENEQEFEESKTSECIKLRENGEEMEESKTSECIEMRENGEEMEESETSKYIELRNNNDKMEEPGQSGANMEETVVNESETTKETLINESETMEEILIDESETMKEVLTESVSDDLTEEAIGNKSTQNINTRLPLARIKQIMKFDPDCSLISRDCLLIVSKATEMFIEFLGKEAVKHTLNNKKKTISKRDVEAAIDCAPNLYFLDGALEWD